MANLFPKTNALIAEFEEFLDLIVRAALTFESILKDYIRNDDGLMQQRLADLSEYESRADELRRGVRFQLYSRMLIPENRGDVLSILENTDSVIDRITKIAMRLDIERPHIPAYLIPGIYDLAGASSSCVDYTIKAAKAYLKEPAIVHDHLNKVHFYEHEADKLENALKRQVFTSDEKRISAKMQLSMVLEEISGIADEAEDVSERISVAAIKREY